MSINDKSCEQCGNAFDFKLNNYGVNPRFCSNECRNDYHNERKRVKRVYSRMIEDILYLREKSLKSGDLGHEASDSMRQLAELMNKA